MQKSHVLLLISFFICSSIIAQEIEKGRYSFKTGSRRQIVVITDTEVRTSAKSKGLEVHKITERRDVEGVKLIICDIGHEEKMIISQTMNGKNLFMYKWTKKDMPIDDMKYWQMKKKSSNKLKKTFSQTKTNW